jgi:hypothetical protein
MLFLIQCFDGPDGREKRPPVRGEHLAHAEAQGRALRLAGPMLDDAGGPIGSVFVLDCPDRAAAEAFANADPYQQAGVFARREITPMRALLGGWPKALPEPSP